MTTASDMAGSAPTPGGDRPRQRTFTWEDPGAILAAGADLSGVEIFTAMRDGVIPPPPITKTLDFDGVSFAEGTATFQLTPQEFHYNPLGTVHGGVLATLLDSACGCAVHTLLPAGVFYTSLDLALKFLRPVTTRTGPVTAQASVTHLGRRTALAEGRITDAAGKLYATATSSCLVIRPE
ncbi:PaaI family thioesterase [Frankia sp. Ag45/Mut15]|uniref:PaaI family thioesterase n=1 Tax=Frankia umida TaxID=573489 RepID=A0ABT0K2K8_9ACTN|nr:PaaI family thioesterase [Frankia umida]MCK9878027.1 PaaI family thioesterase [Frankia umida]